MRIIPLAVLVLLGIMLFAIPNMTRREILFAVPVPPDFRKSCAGRRAVSVFRSTTVIAVLAGICALLLSPARLLNAVATAMPITLLVVCSVSFYWQNRRLAPAAVQYTRPQEAEMTVAPDRLPWFSWFGAGPLIILAAVALWLHFNWNLIPLRYPVHFNFAGQPNRWVDRSVMGVYGRVIFGAELCLWALILAFAGWFGSRRSRIRRAMLGGVIGLGYFFAVVFGLIALQGPLSLPAWVIVLAPLVIMLSLISVMSNMMNQPGGQMDTTPNECWKGAIFYYNPNDAALVVEKRTGLGFTFNLANPWSWALLAGLAMVVVSAPFILG